MKTLTFIITLLISTQSLSSHIILDLSSYDKVSDSTERQKIAEGLVLANGDSTYGSCGLMLDWPLYNNGVEVYVSKTKVNPAIFYVSDPIPGNGFVKINTNQDQTKIVSIEHGDLRFTKFNIGTLTSPYFIEKMTILSSEDANSCD